MTPKILSRSLSLTGVILLLLAGGCASSGHGLPPVPEEPEIPSLLEAALASGEARCPVCGQILPTDQSMAYVYAGRTYHFCRPECLKEFKRVPRDYLPPGTRGPDEH